MKSSNISIIIRTKNSSNTLYSCLNSINKQTLQPLEIIIIDSGSTDNTIEIAQEFNCVVLQYPSDLPFNYSKSLNIGIKKSIGKYIMPISSHVILENINTIQFMLNFLIKNKRICVISTKKKVDNYQINYCQDIKWSIISPYDFKGIAMFNFCSLFRKKHWKEHQFNEIIPSAEDQEWVYFFMKKYNYGAGVIHNPYILYLNPYKNIKKDIRDTIIIGRHIYPPLLKFKNILKLLKSGLINSFIKFDFYNAYKAYRIAFALIKEKIGIKVKFTSNYNKLLE